MMEMDCKLCFICCFTTSASAPILPSSPTHSVNNRQPEVSSTSQNDFKLFCEQLELEETIASSGVNPASSRKGNGSIKRIIGLGSSLIPLLKISSSPAEKTEKVTVCADCQNLISSAMDKKRQMLDMEDQVRKLQFVLLKLLKVLQGHVEGFSRDMRKIGDNVKNSDESYINSYISEDDVKSRKIKEDIGLFRERVVEVSSSLDSYQSNLERVTVSKHRTKLTTEEPPTAHVMEDVKMEMEVNPHPFPDEDGDLAQVENDDWQQNDYDDLEEAQEKSEYVGENLFQEDKLICEDPLSGADLHVDTSNTSDYLDTDSPPPRRKKRKYVKRKRKTARNGNKCNLTKLQNLQKQKYSPPSQQPLPPLEFLKTSRGKKCLVLNGYLHYIRHRQKNHIYYTCSERKTKAQKEKFPTDITCNGCVTVVDYNEEDDSYSTYLETTPHVEHPKLLDKIKKLRMGDYTREPLDEKERRLAELKGKV